MRGNKQFKEKLLDYYDYHERDKLESRIANLNHVYGKQGLSIVLNDEPSPLDFGRIVLVDKATKKEKLGDFFFYPKHVIYEFGGQERTHYGFNVCFVKLKATFDSNTVIKETTINLSKKELETGAWMEKKALKEFKLKESAFDIKALVKSLTNTKWDYKNEIVMTSVIGWVEARGQHHYVPTLNAKKSGIKCTEDIDRTFKSTIGNDMNGIDTYRKMKELLDITKPEITIPLISHTIMSSLKSLIRQHCKADLDFMLCVSGDNGKQKETLSNLLCNIYNRTSHIYELDSSLHVNQSLKSDISEKAEKLRDAVFICKVNKLSDLKPLSKLLKQTNVFCGLLLISSAHFEHDSVINIDVNGAQVEKRIVQYHRENPAIFTNWLYYFTGYIQKELQDNIGVAI